MLVTEEKKLEVQDHSFSFFDEMWKSVLALIILNIILTIFGTSVGEFNFLYSLGLIIVIYLIIDTIYRYLDKNYLNSGDSKVTRLK